MQRRGLQGADFFDVLKDELPPIFTRETAAARIGGLFSARTLSNLDAAGKGPRKTRIGKKVCYGREDFLMWLRGMVIDSDPTCKEAVAS